MQKIFFIISGLVCFSVAIYRIYKKSKYVKVQGTCVYVKYSRGFDKKCGYQYKYNSSIYEYYDKSYYPYFKAKKGNMYKLFINPDNANECITPSSNATTRDLIIVGCLCVYLAFSL